MIETKQLGMRFTDREVIRYRDLQFEQGKKYVLLGASGCGKSTLLNLIAGVLTPTEGEVCIDGRALSAATQKERDQFRIREIGYVFQDFKLLPAMTVEDNVRLLELEGVSTQNLDVVLRELGILSLKKKRVEHLSGGEKQRVAIARALIKRPRILLADEPTGNLNYEIGREVMALLAKTCRDATLIAVTHDDRLIGFFDTVIDMNDVAYSEDEGARA